MSQRSVLILCDLFPPAFGPRMGYLCKYLEQNGWRPVVVTEYVDDGDLFSFLAGDTEVIRIRYYRQKGLAGKIEWGWTFLRDILFGYKDRRMYRQALETVRQRRFDLILCSAFRTFPLPAARRLAAATHLPLLVDLRDIIEQYTGNEFIRRSLPKIFGLDRLIVAAFRARNLRIRNATLREAAGITTVSPWHVSVLKKYNPNTHLIYNGYDPDVFYPSSGGMKSDTFYITYTGRLLSTAMRDPDLLFRAVEKLLEEGVISPGLFQVRWFTDGKSKEILLSAAAPYTRLNACMSYYDYVPATEIPRILNESEILLLLTNKSGADGPKGVMTTKFFESLAVGKPILCVRGDEGCLEEIIHRTRSGLSAHSVDEVCEFIKAHYLRWKKGLPYEDPSDKNQIKQFSRETQARHFIHLFEQLTPHP
ncbi:MAG: glycosyltransferase [Tannerella sp.]|jgi:glycosyltransferase involved in cell wall biosynthesis|nr:glycosyltransferase [Tannerella sp.]